MNTEQAVMTTMITIFSAALFFSIKNTWKYWNNKDGANDKRILFIGTSCFFILHYSNILFNFVPRGFFSSLAGACFLLLLAEGDIAKLWDKIKKALS